MEVIHTQNDAPRLSAENQRLREVCHNLELRVAELNQAYADLAHMHEGQIRTHMDLEREMKNRLGL